MLDNAIIRNIVTPRRVRASADRRPPGRGRPAHRLIHEALDAWNDGIRFESPMEVRLFRRLVSWGFARPVGQHQVVSETGAKVARLDLAWPDRMIGLEYNGRLPHSPRKAGHDEGRIATLEALGWTIEEVDRHDLEPSSTRLRERLEELFAATPAPNGPRRTR